MKSKIVEVLDATMPGRRIGSAQPPDYSGAVETDLAKVEECLPENLGLTSVREFLASHGLPSHDGYAREFRRQAIRNRLRRASREQ